MMRWGMIVAAALSLSLSPAVAQEPSRPAPTPIASGQSIDGTLAQDDVRRRFGKFEDVYVLQGRRGQRVDLRLSSPDFDAFLVMIGPDGFSVINDDEEGGGGLHSRLVVELPSDGAYRIAVTSFRPGETGTYRLSAAEPPAGITIERPSLAAELALGSTVSGRLESRDGRRGAGHYADHHRFTARRGERVRIEMRSAKFDTYLALRHPDGTEDVNDDGRIEGARSTDSRLDVVLPEDGEYVIVASSFTPQAAGEYRLSLQRSPGLARQVNVPGGPRVIALLVGVSDYGGRTSNLPNTDDDASQLYSGLREAGLLHPASVALTNAQATRKGVSDAFRRIAAAAGPGDLFLFLFSGHGDQVDVPVSAAELDGRAETIELYDAAMRDSELAPLFTSVQARLSLLVIDACYAGGFRSLIDRPNIVGMFSSEEDLTSLVASRFQAGGFLSYFLRAGITGEADDDGDGIVTAGELSTYVRRRFRVEGDIPATTREDERNYQNLLVERGGVHIDDVIVRLNRATN